MREDLIGYKKNRLTIISDTEDKVCPSGQKKRCVVCKCECGTIFETLADNVKRGSSKSCGCLQLEKAKARKGTKNKNKTVKPFKDLSGNTYGMLYVLSKYEWFEGSQKRNTRSWICVCNCGVFTVLMEDRLKRNVSCGCYRKEVVTTHGKSKTSTYRIYYGMHQRCYDPRSKKYSLYGGNGVIVCDRWNYHKEGSFENFLEDMGERPKGMSLNRINGVKIYSKETCEWASGGLQSYDRLLDSKMRGIIHNECGTYSVRIGHQNKIIHLGTYDSYEEAKLKRIEGELNYYGFTVSE